MKAIHESDQYIIEHFQSARLKKDWPQKLLEDLSEMEWSDPLDKKEFIERLKALSLKEGVPFPFEFSLSYAPWGKMEEHTADAFEKSVTSIFSHLLRADVANEIKGLFLNDYLTFFSRFRVTPQNENLNQIQLRLLEIKNDLVYEKKYIPPLYLKKKHVSKLSEAFLKKVIEDLYLSFSTKKCFLIAAKQYQLFSNSKIDEYLTSPLLENEKIGINKKSFFNPSNPNNNQYIQFKKNLFFTHFYVLCYRAKCEGPLAPIERIYSLENLNLTIQLCEDLFLGRPPLELTKDYVKYSLKDFRNSKF